MIEARIQAVREALAGVQPDGDWEFEELEDLIDAAVRLQSQLDAALKDAREAWRMLDDLRDVLGPPLEDNEIRAKNGSVLQMEYDGAGGVTLLSKGERIGFIGSVHVGDRETAERQLLRIYDFIGREEERGVSP